MGVAKQSLKVIVFVSLLVLILFLLFHFGASHYKVSLRQQMDDVLSEAKNIEALALGNSHANAIVFPAMGLVGKNVNAGGQDMFEVEYKVNRLLPIMPNLKVVFVAMSYHSLFYDNSAFLKNGVNRREGKRIDLYSQFPFSFLWIRGDFANYLKGSLYPLVTKDHWGRVFSGDDAPHVREKRRLPKNIGTRSLKRQRLLVQKLKPKHNRRGLLLRSKKAVKAFRATTSNMARQNPDIVSQSLDATILYCKKLKNRGVRVIFFTPPYYPQFIKLTASGLKKTMYESIEKIQRETGAEYYDFSQDSEFKSYPQVFVNADHLTHQGSVLFSLKLKAAINNKNHKKRLAEI